MCTNIYLQISQLDNAAKKVARKRNYFQYVKCTLGFIVLIYDVYTYDRKRLVCIVRVVEKERKEEREFATLSGLSEFLLSYAFLHTCAESEFIIIKQLLHVNGVGRDNYFF